MTDSAMFQGRSRPAPRIGSRSARSSRPPVIVAAFLVALIIPAVMHLGPLRLSPYRLLLLAAFLPMLFAWVGGAAGRTKAPDILILFYAIWAAVAMTVHHGVSETWQGNGIFMVEAFGAYLLGRLYVRSAESFRYVVKFIFIITLMMIPLAFIESYFNGLMPLNKILSFIFPTYSHNFAFPRWGLNRAQVSFEHSILYGVFVSSGLAMFFYTFSGKNTYKGAFLHPFASAVATFFSLSLGAYISAALQVGLIIYDRVTRNMGLQNRWWLLIWTTVAAYIFVDLASNRGPVLIFIQTFAFNEFSSAVRIHIWIHGSAAVWANPMFGIGMNDWPRPSWLTSSVDNFWLLNGMRYGLPGVGALIAAFAIVLLRLSRLQFSDLDKALLRKGFIMSMAGLSLALCTVHLWNATFAYFMFLLGSGVWMLDDPDAHDPKAQGKSRRPAPAEGVATTAPTFVSGGRAAARDGTTSHSSPGRSSSDDGPAASRRKARFKQSNDGNVARRSGPVRPSSPGRGK